MTDYAAYVGGSGKADPSKSPVTIGWVNQQGGQEVIGAAATDGADFAVKAINDLYGGIDGHPVVLKKCFIKSAEEEGTTCAQQLGNDAAVKVVDMGGVATGIQSFYSSIDKPVITGVAATPIDGIAEVGDRPVRRLGPRAGADGHLRPRRAEGEVRRDGLPEHLGCARGRGGHHGRR